MKGDKSGIVGILKSGTFIFKLTKKSFFENYQLCNEIFENILRATKISIKVRIHGTKNARRKLKAKLFMDDMEE